MGAHIPKYAGDPKAKYKFFTICGDSCVFDKDFMKGMYLRNADGSAVSFEEMADELKLYGYNGIMYDWEIFDYPWSEEDNEALNWAFEQARAHGLYSAWTTSAMGPFRDNAPQSVPIDIQWENLDFALPQMYDGHQNYYENGLDTYAPWWSKGGKSIHGFILKKPCVPGNGCTTTFLWGASLPAAGPNSKTIGKDTAGAAQYLTGLPGGFIEWVYACKNVDGGC